MNQSDDRRQAEEELKPEGDVDKHESDGHKGGNDGVSGRLLPDARRDGIDGNQIFVVKLVFFFKSLEKLFTLVGVKTFVGGDYHPFFLVTAIGDIRALIVFVGNLAHIGGFESFMKIDGDNCPADEVNPEVEASEQQRANTDDNQNERNGKPDFGVFDQRKLFSL